ncbi:glycyl radical protein, partial [Candidatus Aerophobetes bacterium]|nr:glycyl radical protein [Candidatus Aerophobetes bacterium]
PHKMPELTRQLMNIKHKVFHPEIHLRGGIGHVSADFWRILKQGFEGLKKEAEQTLAGLDFNDADNLDKMNFYQAAIITCEGVINFAQRYANLARKLAAEEKDLRRKEELEKIARVCEQVPAKPARTYHEALQAIWFSHLLVQIESNGLGASPGRMDQYLYPFYKKDIEEGIITKEEAQELLECFWVKIEEIKRVYDSECARDYAGYTTELNITVGGQKEDGSDATNEVSYMCLDAQDHLRTAHPNFTVRYHNKLPETLLHKACQVIKLGTGMPELMNDEAHIPSLMNRGIKLEDARGYTNIGCVEPAVPGKTCSWSNAAMFNLGKCLELALNNGKCMLCGEQVGAKTGDACNFTCTEDLMRAYKEQVAYFVKHMIVCLNAIDFTHKEMVQTPYLSLLVSDCMEKGKDITAGGAHYNFTSPQGVGVADVGDSLAAIKKLVFEDKTVSMDDLLSALKENFENNEELRQRLINEAPKYGNDDDYVDPFAKFAGRVYCEEVEKYKNPRGGIFNPGLYPVSAHVPLGRNTAALPSGRKATTPLADGVSPTHASDKKGPTAVVKSVAKLDHMIASNGTLLNQKFSPNVLEDEKGLRSLAELIKVYFNLGGKHIQFNVIDSRILREAQKNPEKYANLVVRVAGYSAFFAQLHKDIQDDIIERTEQVGF